MDFGNPMIWTPNRPIQDRIYMYTFFDDRCQTGVPSESSSLHTPGRLVYSLEMDRSAHDVGPIPTEHPLNTTPTGSRRSFISSPLGIFLLIGIIAFIAYSNTFSVPFQFDDFLIIVNNLKIKEISGFLDLSRSRYIGNLSFALNYSIGGLSPFGYHVINLMIHMGNGMLAYLMVLLLCRSPLLSSDTSVKSSSHWMASATAVLFISHPIQTESVTYIVQRFASLSTFFYLLAIVGYLQWRTNRSSSSHPIIWYLAALLAAILAMKTKESTFTLPFMLVLIEALFFSGFSLSKQWYALAPFLFTLPIIPLSHSGVLGKGTSGIARETMDISRWDYFVTQLRVIVTYLRLLIFPVGQNLDYDYPVYHSILTPPVLLSFLFLSGLFTIAVALPFISGRSQNLFVTRFVAFGILWFFLTLSVESSFIPIRDVIFEHRIYMPSIGFFMVVAALSVGMAARWRVATMIALAVCVILLAIATYKRNTIWKDAATLWSDVLTKSPNKARPHLSRGTAYDDAGEHEEAAREYQTALRLRPGYAEAHNNLGMIYLRQGDLSKARFEFEQAIANKPRFATAQNNLGLILVREGKLTDALTAFKETVELNRTFAEGYYNLGNVYRDLGDIPNAVQNYQIASKLDPDNSQAHTNLGLGLYLQGHTKEALTELERAVQIDPNSAEARNNLGVVYRNMGRFNDAVREFLLALKINPEYVQAYVNLGVAYENLGQMNEAAKAFESALAINPRDAKVLYELGNVYSILNRNQDAISQYELAIRLDPKSAEAYYRLGVVYRESDRIQDAKRAFMRALDINPENRKAREALNALPRN